MTDSSHILVLSHYFYPELNAPAHRIYDHAKIWIKQKVNVTVITNNPNHPHGEIFPGYQNDYSDKIYKGVRVIRVKTYMTPNSGFFKRILNYLTFMIRAILSGRKIDNVDIVFATSPQLFCGIAGAILSKILKKPFVLEVRDIWPESIITLGVIKNKYIIEVLKYLEKWMVKSAYKVIVVTKGIEDHIRSLSHNNILLIPNGVFIKEIKEIQLRPVKKEEIVFAYFGTIGMAHNVEFIINAARNFKNNNKIKFVIAGDGSERKNVLQSAASLDNVKIFPQLSRTKLLELYKFIDVGLVTLKNMDQFKGALPSKLFEYLSMGKPVILNMPEGEATELIQKYSCGITTKPDSEDELYSAMIRYINEPELYKLHGQNGRILVEKHFNRSNLAIQLISALFPKMKSNEKFNIDQI